MIVCKKVTDCADESYTCDFKTRIPVLYQHSLLDTPKKNATLKKNKINSTESFRSMQLIFHYTHTTTVNT